MKSHMKRKWKCCICLLCSAMLFSFPSTAVAEDVTETEQIAIDLIDHHEGHSSVLYNNTNGLPTSEANAIAETQEGFIWIGSYSGLIRYDGNTFERINSINGIASVVSLYVDKKNRLWVGTNDSGATVIDKDNYQRFDKNDGLNSLSIRAITEDENGNIYIATTQGIAVIDESMSLHMIDEPQINHEYIRNLKLGSDNVIYGVTMGGAIFTIQNEKLTGYYSSSQIGISGILSLYPDNEKAGLVYIGTKESKVYYAEISNGFRKQKEIDTSPLEYINSIKQVQNEIWICADNGLGVIKDNKFISLDNLPLNSSAEQMITDYQGNLWFTSSKQGVMKIVPNQFQDIFESYGLPDTVVNSTCMYDDKLVIGSKNEGLTVINKDGIVEKMPIKKAISASGEILNATDLIQMMNGCRIRSVIRDSKNRLWISTFGENGLVCYDNGNVTQFTQKDGLPSDRIRTVYERKDGSFMVACTGGVAIIKNNAIAKIYNESDGIQNPEILTVVEADNGDMLIGTDGGGIYIIHTDGNITHYGTESGLSSDVIMRIKKDVNRNLFWIVTSNSITYMTEEEAFTTIEKFPYSNNFDLYENSQGEIWILSSNGIYVVPAENLLANDEIDAVFYGKDNGLPCIATSNSYSELTEDGNLYISGTNGIAKVNIEKPFEDVSEIKMNVPYVEADGKYIYPDSSGIITLSSDVQKLTIHGFVYNYSLMNPQITYYLDGFDSHQTTVRRSELVPVNYTNLKGGNYHFIMEMYDTQGEDSQKLSVSIVKQKAVHEMIGFQIAAYFLIALLGAGIFMLFIHRREKQLLKKQEEQKILIREIVQAFAKVIDMKDHYTNGHSARVAEYTAMLTRELGYDEETVETYYSIALLHDIGKVGIPEDVLNKAGKLTDEEYKIIKSHTVLGRDTLKNISIMPELAIGAGSHHERPDGKGYPDGLKGDEIPRVAQIIAVADTFDAMYSNRPYRKRMNFEKAVSIIREVSGTQLTQDVVDAFLRLVERGEFRAPDDDGSGTTENIDNIHKKFQSETKSTPS